LSTKLKGEEVNKINDEKTGRVIKGE